MVSHRQLQETNMPIAKVDLGKPQKGTFEPKSGLTEPHHLSPPTKTPSLTHFVTKSGPFGLETKLV